MWLYDSVRIDEAYIYGALIFISDSYILLVPPLRTSQPAIMKELLQALASRTLTAPLHGHCFCSTCSYTLDPSIPIKSDSFVKTFGSNIVSFYDRLSSPPNTSHHVTSRHITGVD